MTIGYTGMNPFMNPSGLDTMMNAPILGSGMGMGYGMGVGMMNPQSMMSNIQQWDDFGVNRQVAAFKNQNNAQFQMQAQNGSIQRQARILAQQVKANNQDNVRTEYNKLLRAIKASYGSSLNGAAEVKEDTLKQYADQVYAQVNGSYLEDDLRQYGRSSFGSGFMKVFSFGLGNKTTVEENLEYITGAQQTRADKAKNVCGKVLGTICTLGLGWLGQ